MFAIGSIWYFQFTTLMGLFLLWWPITRAIVRRCLKKDGLWDISLDRFLTEMVPKLLPVDRKIVPDDREKAVFLYQHITKKSFSESLNDINTLQAYRNQNGKNAVKDNGMVGPLIVPTWLGVAIFCSFGFWLCVLVWF
jgi:hypothetical protein